MESSNLTLSQMVAVKNVECGPAEISLTPHTGPCVKCPNGSALSGQLEYSVTSIQQSLVQHYSGEEITVLDSVCSYCSNNTLLIDGLCQTCSSGSVIVDYECVECGIATYSNGLACKPCPGNKTSSVGSYLVHSCGCPEGFIEESLDGLTGFHLTAIVCTICASGMMCLFNTTTISCLPNYYLDSTCLPCPNDKSCPGGLAPPVDLLPINAVTSSFS